MVHAYRERQKSRYSNVIATIFVGYTTARASYPPREVLPLWPTVEKEKEVVE